MKIKSLFAFIVSVFLVNTLFGTVFTNQVTEAEFDTAFADMEFYVELRPGGNSGSDSHEFELGTPSGVSYMGELPDEPRWLNDLENPFIIDISNTGFLSATVNSETTPLGNQPGLLNPFNEIWIGLKLNTGIDLDDLSLTSHEYNGASIDNPFIQDGAAGAWYGFKLIDDLKLSNIADFTIGGNIVPGMHFGPGINENWTYTVFGKYDPATVPEPATYALLFGVISLGAVMLKRR